MSESKPPEIVFDVGGRTFKVSRSLIEHYSETMLGRLISDEWQANSNDESIFVDRNGDLFAFVLDYLRYGSVELPHNVPRSNFLRTTQTRMISGSNVIPLSTRLNTSVHLMHCKVTSRITMDSKPVLGLTITRSKSRFRSKDSRRRELVVQRKTKAPRSGHLQY